MGRTVTLSFTWPTQRPDDGSSLDPFSEILHLEVSMDVAGAPTQSVVTNIVPDQNDPSPSHDFPNVDFGDWVFFLVVVDTDGQRSNGKAEPFTVLKAVPGDVENVVVSVS